MNDEKVSFDYIVTPYQESIPNVIKMNPVIYWLLFATVLIAFDHYALIHFDERPSIHIPHFILGSLSCIIPLATIWFSKILEDFTPSLFMFIDWEEERTLKWYSEEIRSIFDDKWMMWSGVIMTSCMLPISFIIGQLVPTNLIPKLTFLAIMISLYFLAGSLIYVMIRICIMVNKLGDIDAIKVSVYQHPMVSVKAVGKLMGKISFTIIGIYIYGITYLIFTRSDMLMIFITIFFGVFVLVFFIFPQIKVHKIMSKVKHKRLMVFSTYLENALQDVTDDPSQQNIQRVKELFGIQQSLVEMGEWPFNTKILFPLLAGIATPLIIAILQLICGEH